MASVSLTDSIQAVKWLALRNRAIKNSYEEGKYLTLSDFRRQVPAIVRTGMCGRFASSLPLDAIRALFRTTNAIPNLSPSWNVDPIQAAMVVRLNPETNDRHLDLLKWGLCPDVRRCLLTEVLGQDPTRESSTILKVYS